jgi:hypothetical protein
MLKFATALFAAVIVGWSLVGSATTARADGYDEGYHRGYGGCCGPIAPSYHYTTKKVHKHVKRVHNVYRTKYVPRIKRIVHVTRIQPVVHIHDITRVHTKIVGVIKKVHIHKTVMLPPEFIKTRSVVYLRPTCGCASGSY